MSDEELRQNLSYNFKNDLLKIKTTDDAKNIFDKYGTHLLTGYTLGGIFSMTNYFATCSDTYVRENSTSFNAQVNAGMSSIGNVNSGFSFSDSYSSKDNNSYAVNNYKCITYGGDSFPSLTMDQAFKYYETFGKAGYIYDIWTKSINDGKNLVIVDIPQNSRLVPLWDLLPLDESYTTARSCLLDYYINKLQKSCNEFGVKYPDVYGKSTNHANEGSSSSSIEFNGYNVSRFDNDESKCKNMYFPLKKNGKGVLFKNSFLSFDFVTSFVNGEWSIITEKKEDSASIDSTFQIIDKKNGVFRINEISECRKFYFVYKVGEKVIYSKAFEFQNSYSGGDGTKENPYLISSADELKNLAENPDNFDKNFKLLNDITFTDEWSSPIGTYERPFTGTFDGDKHTIENLKLDLANNDNNGFFGLFGVNKGVIKNINILNESSFSNNNSLSEGKIYLGGVCGYNHENGKLSNINVKKSNLIFSNLDNWKNSTNVPDKSFVTSGSLCGLNEGTISECNVSESKLVIADVRKEQIICGGLVGTNYSKNSTVENSSTKRPKVIAYVGNKNCDKLIRAITGGLIGVVYEGSLKNCSVSELNSNISNDRNLSPSEVSNLTHISNVFSNEYSLIYSNCTSKENSLKMISIAGGLVGSGYYNGMTNMRYYGEIVFGKGNENCEISSCVITNVIDGSILAKTQNVDVKTQNTYLNSNPVDDELSVIFGFLFGHLEQKQGIKNLEAIGVSHNKVIDRLTKEQFKKKYPDSSWYNIDLKSENWKTDGFDTFIDDSVWDVDEESGLPTSYKKTLLGEKTINFDFTDAKKTFYQGDAFMPGNIKVTASPKWSENELKSTIIVSIIVILIQQLVEQA